MKVRTNITKQGWGVSHVDLSSEIEVKKRRGKDDYNFSFDVCGVSRNDSEALEAIKNKIVEMFSEQATETDNDDKKYFVYDAETLDTEEFDNFDHAKSCFDDRSDHYANLPEDDSEVYLLQPIQKGFWKREDGESFVVRKYDI